MLKNDSKYVINGKQARFLASVRKTSLTVKPIAIFTFEDGESITVEQNKITGESIYSSPIDRPIYYENGEWRFL
jgi:hypothetical protein